VNSNNLDCVLEEKMITAKVRIGDVMRECGLSRTKASFYTIMGLLKTVGRTDTGANLYDLEETIKRIEMIKELQSQRFKIKEIKEKLDEKF
jgi:DNA-binding transcriptional MerR regulator